MKKLKIDHAIEADFEKAGNKSAKNERYDDNDFHQPQRPSLPSLGKPGVYCQSNLSPPPVHVDDKKVARLVAMDFDPEKVLHSLRKYDNNFDQALNDLLA